VYIVYSCSIFIFLNNFETIIQHLLEHCPIIIFENFSIDILDDNNHAKKRNFTNKFKLKSQFSESTIKIRFPLKYIWANAFGNEFKFGVIKAHWKKFHKSIYIAFKLSNMLPIYNKKPITYSFF